MPTHPTIVRIALITTVFSLGLAAPATATDRPIDDTCAAAPDAGFADVGHDNVHWQRIDCIAHLGITTGLTATTYGPSGVLTSDQLASFLARTLAAGEHALPPASSDYFDDDDGSPHEGAINRLAEAGIVKATSRTFGTRHNPTRAEMSRLTAAALTWAGALPATADGPWFFSDTAGSPDRGDIDRLADAGIITGRAPGTFAPAGLLTRAQMATFLARSVDALLDGPGSHHHCVLTTPERPRFDAFYTQECSVFGISIVGSPHVAPEAFTAAVDVVIGMLGRHPALHAHMADAGFYLILLGEEEHQTDPPEYRDLDPVVYNTRGLGGIDVASAGEENVLCLPSDPYLGESILVHEFAHSIMDDALDSLYPGFQGRVRTAYDAAMAAGKWTGTYAATNHHEYWAEGVQSWFGTNFESDPPDGIHNHVNTPDELRTYDRPLYDLVAEGLVSTWQYACPS